MRVAEPVAGREGIAGLVQAVGGVDEEARFLGLLHAEQPAGIGGGIPAPGLHFGEEAELKGMLAHAVAGGEAGKFRQRFLW